jgi:hypothetical protein
MEISITSDMTMAGTEITVDGKKVKNVSSMNMSVYTEYHCCAIGETPSEGTPVVSINYSTEETQDDGTEKRVNYNICKKGNDEAVMDSVTVNPTAEQIADELAKKCMGRKSIL